MALVLRLFGLHHSFFLTMHDIDTFARAPIVMRGEEGAEVVIKHPNLGPSLLACARARARARTAKTGWLLALLRPWTQTHVSHSRHRKEEKAALQSQWRIAVQEEMKCDQEVESESKRLRSLALANARAGQISQGEAKPRYRVHTSAPLAQVSLLLWNRRTLSKRLTASHRILALEGGE
jgi:hypothetical protein